MLAAALCTPLAARLATPRQRGRRARPGAGCRARAGTARPRLSVPEARAACTDAGAGRQPAGARAWRQRARGERGDLQRPRRAAGRRQQVPHLLIVHLDAGSGCVCARRHDGAAGLRGSRKAARMCPTSSIATVISRRAPPGSACSAANSISSARALSPARSTGRGASAAARRHGLRASAAARVSSPARTWVVGRALHCVRLAAARAPDRGSATPWMSNAPQELGARARAPRPAA